MVLVRLRLRLRRARVCIPLRDPGFEPRAVTAQNAALASYTTAAVHCQWGDEKRSQTKYQRDPK